MWGGPTLVLPPSHGWTWSAHPCKEMGTRSGLMMPPTLTQTNLQSPDLGRSLGKNRKSQACTERQESNQSHQGHCAGRVRKRFLRCGGCLHWRGRGLSSDCGYRGLFGRRLNCLHRLDLQCCDGRFSFEWHCQDRLTSYFCQLHRPRLGVHKFLAPLISGIKPCPDGLRLSFSPLCKRHHGLVSRLQSVVRYGKDG